LKLPKPFNPKASKLFSGCNPSRHESISRHDVPKRHVGCLGDSDSLRDQNFWWRCAVVGDVQIGAQTGQVLAVVAFARDAKCRSEAART
jgi:hypothetical protein